MAVRKRPAAAASRTTLRKKPSRAEKAKPAPGGTHNAMRRAARQKRSQPLAAYTARRPASQERSQPLAAYTARPPASQERSQPTAVATPEEALTEASEDYTNSLTSQWTPIGETA